MLHGSRGCKRLGRGFFRLGFSGRVRSSGLHHLDRRLAAGGGGGGETMTIKMLLILLRARNQGCRHENVEAMR